ncbi:aminopeptidase [Pseudodesulfovibrio piezophilus]|uniref:M18 family aminopeptidase n=1 Tax=Pseudodesulfovibrio piezophilus (strain DSM 21447 / JCM 15486 / C1TLV30) TaxID=1322246 RepID=M1WU77_PSEP2|nr:aminopeptidase [Pseudodesulfovibrio piezophilus]CCH50317.1 putative M18 family aminopeptidase 1 [Pseudodesulfovibrio piezophilus C1TLV30]
MSKKDSLEYEPKSAWDVYTSKKDIKAMDQLADRYVDFLSRCKTERLVMDYVREKVQKAGFVDDLKAPLAYRFNRNKTCFLARKGKRPLSEGFRLIGAHADCPRLDLKQRPFYEDLDIALAKTHYYGGIRKYQWLTIPLALHGTVVKKDGTVVTLCIGEDPGDPVFTVTDLLPHLAYKEVVKKVEDAFEAEKLNLIMGHSPVQTGKKDDDAIVAPVKRKMLELLNKKYGIDEADFLSAEVQAVPAGPARYVGLDEAVIGSYGQDDRSSVFCGLEALLEETQPEYAQIVLFWDKEEIGSDGATGAKSLFFEYCMEELLDAWEPGARLSGVMMNGSALSADVSAAMDPDYKDVYEPLNAARLGYGPCFNKFTGHRGKVGANDAHPDFIGWLRRIFDDAGIPWHMSELGKVDVGGGGTVAKFLAIYGMDVIDVGVPVLSMHSPFELAAKADIYACTLAFREFLKN